LTVSVEGENWKSETLTWFSADPGVLVARTAALAVAVGEFASPVAPELEPQPANMVNASKVSNGNVRGSRKKRCDNGRLLEGAVNDWKCARD
jgi:hypothetical protein